MADCIAERLDFNAFSAIRNIITATPQPENVYDQVKAKLIATFGKSAGKRLQQLIKDEVD